LLRQHPEEHSIPDTHAEPGAPKAQEPVPSGAQTPLPPDVSQHPEAHSELSEQGQPFVRVPLPALPEQDCAVAAVGRTSDEITGSATTEVKPIRRITSRRDKPVKFSSGVSFFASRFSFESRSSASHTTSSLAGAPSMVESRRAISGTPVLPSHNFQTSPAVLFKQKFAIRFRIAN
jgi:hypothetical protein